jgi:hypothetical protein
MAAALRWTAGEGDGMVLGCRIGGGESDRERQGNEHASFPSDGGRLIKQQQQQLACHAPVEVGRRSQDGAAGDE